MIDRLVSWLFVRRIFGPRCPDFNPDCHVCWQWAEHDERFRK